MNEPRTAAGHTGGHLGRRRRAVVGVALPLAVSGLAGCGAPADDQAAGQAALTFAFRAGTDPAAACADLAPRTLQELERSAVEPCPEALENEGLPGSTTIARTVVAGHSALVELADPSQTMFLARFDSGWKIVAAGCRRESADDAVPYTCRISGG